LHICKQDLVSIKKEETVAKKKPEGIPSVLHTNTIICGHLKLYTL